MKKDKKPLLLIKPIFLFLTLLLSQISYSQCPTGDPVQDFCVIDNNTVNDIVVTGISVSWYDAATGGNLYDASEPLVNGNTYYAVDTDPSCTDPTRLPVVVNIYGYPPANVNVFVGKCAEENAIVSDLSATGTNIQWYDAQIGGTMFNPSDSLIDGQQYWVQQTENGCTSERLPTTVTIIDPLPPVVTLDQAFCSPPNPTIADLQATGTNVQWYATETSTVPLDSSLPLVNGEDYWATQTSFPCESTARAVANVTIDPAPDAGVNDSISICEIDTATINLFEELGGSPDINGTWSGPDTLSGGYLGTFDPTTNTPGDYTYTVSSTGTSGICPDESAIVSVTILIVPPPTTTNTTQNFCIIDFAPSGPTVADLSATGTNIQWYDTETSTTPLNGTDLLVDGEDYWASETDGTGCESVSRLVVTITLTDPLPPTTSEVNQTFCVLDFTPSGPTVADLSATGTNIQWYNTETSTTPLNGTDLLIDGEDYWASETDSSSGCESSIRLVINVTIIDQLPPTTLETTQTFCLVDFIPNQPTIADINITGTGVLWYDTETSTTPLNPTDSLIDGEDYWASQSDTSSGCESVSRLQVTIIINDPPIPTTSEVNQTFCLSDYIPLGPTVNDISVSGTNIQWYDTETSTTPLNLTDLLVDGEDYWAAENNTTTGCESSTRLVVTITIINPAPPTINETNQSFCSIDNPTIADIDATGGNILWYDTETSTTPLNLTDLLVDGEDYWATQSDSTTGCESIPRIVVNITIIDLLPPTTINTTQSFCVVDFTPDGPTVADLNATGTNIQWYASETDTTPLDSTEILIDGEDYWATQSDSTTGCESPTRLVVTVIVIDPPVPTTTESNQTFCLSDFLPLGPTIADLSVAGTNIQWYDTETSTTPLNLTDLLVDGEDYWAAENDTTSGCESSTRLVINVTVINPPPPTVTSTNQSFCVIDNATIADLEVTGTSILWYDTDTSTTPLDATDILIDGENYWATQSDSTTGCESIPRIEVIVTINDIVAPTTTNVSQSFCAADLPTIQNLDITGTDIVWYADETSTTPLDINDLLIDGENYWAAQTDTTTNCESSTRIVIDVTLTDAGTPTISTSDASFCIIDNPNVSISDLNDALSTNGGTITWFDGFPNGNVLNLSSSLENNTTYYAIETDINGCDSLNPLAITVALDDCDTIEFFDGFSPDGNGVNDTYAITHFVKTLFPDYQIEIFNRWGNSVFKGNANTPHWNGELNGNGNLVPTGVYFYIFHFNKDDRKPRQDRIYLNR